MRIVTVSSCNLNQWALDFVGNRDRIIEAVKRARRDGSSLLVTPELSICGYSCLDAFLERDTTTHSWEVLRDLIKHEDCQNIIVDVGLPIIHRSCLYNCRVIFFNGKILYARPKMALANDGLFREMRYFTPWQRRRVEEYLLPHNLRELTGQRHIFIGDCVLETNDTMIASEMCEVRPYSRSPFHRIFSDIACRNSSRQTRQEYIWVLTAWKLFATRAHRIGSYVSYRGG